MNKHLKSIASRIFSPGERTALRLLLTELTISHYHRQGLRQTPSLPNADPRSDRPRCGGRESKFLADIF